MGKVITTNGARRKLAARFEIKDFNKISVKDVKKYFTVIEVNDKVRYWEPIRNT